MGCMLIQHFFYLEWLIIVSWIVAHIMQNTQYWCSFFFFLTHCAVVLKIYCIELGSRFTGLHILIFTFTVTFMTYCMPLILKETGVTGKSFPTTHNLISTRSAYAAVEGGSKWGGPWDCWAFGEAERGKEATSYSYRRRGGKEIGSTQRGRPS